MWQKLSLRARINLLLALVLTLGLAVNIARLVLDAAPRVQAEDQSVIRLAREFIATLVAGLNDTPDPDARLGQIVQDLNRLRHVSVTWHNDAVEAGRLTNDRSTDDREPHSVPAWFVALVHPEKTAVNVPISTKGKPGSLLITSHPNDEMAEIWDGIVTQLQVGSAIAIVLFLITSTVVSRALSPIQKLSEAMTKIESGDYDTRVRPDGPPELAAICDKLNHLATVLGDAVDELQEMSRGIHPANLARGGLRTALRGLARRSPVPVEVDATSDTRLPEPIEVAVYYVASEALANAAKHAHATRIEVSLAPRNGNLLLSIRDDGVGGADPARGSGLTGLTDRVEALGGRIQVRSPPGDGTEITAELPVELKASEDAD